MIKEKKSMKHEELSELVIKWGKSKGIFDSSTPLRQLDKTQEELDETKEALTNLNNLDYQLDMMEEIGVPSKTREEVLSEVKDGIGDMLVTIILLSEMVGFDTVDCLNEAYDVIKVRTGKMVDGQFVKDQ
jgi:NTP pyrophosphatase (non-canonical NTP hydrolase)